MSQVIEVTVPDIGNFESVEIIEINVKAGEEIDRDDTVITLESDKASIDIPSPEAGLIKQLHVKVGDKVSKGHLILSMETLEPNKEKTVDKEPEAPAEVTAPAPESVPQAEVSTASQLQDIVIPDIGGATGVTIIEVNAAVGDELEAEDTLLTLESEKASMEVPCPTAGILKEWKVKLGDSVSQGDLIGIMEVTADLAKKPAKETAQPVVETPVVDTKDFAEAPQPADKQQMAPVIPTANMPGMQKVQSHATPAVRRLAREFGIDLSAVAGSGRKGRVLREDVQNYVKARLNNPEKVVASQGAGLDILPWPSVDFKQFGEVEEQSLSRINKLSAKNLHRNWVTVPHVTQFDEVDITELEAFRKANKHEAEKQGFKLTPLVFMMKAVACALQHYPKFNASLSADGETLTVKKYCHLGVAVDTPKGLVVPVVRDVDQKSLFDLAQELAQISNKARALKLTAADMQGSSLTISSLGGIGGTAFTPIVNAPDVAILGVSKSQIQPVYDGSQFVPRLMLPLSLSYDHRVIDGADAARFIVKLGSYLQDIRRLLL